MSNTDSHIEALVSAGAIHGVDVSPDGRWICYGTSEGGRTQVWIQSLENRNERRQLSPGPEAAQQPKWSPRGDLIAFLQDVGGDENFQVYAVDPQGGRIMDLTRCPGKLHENFSWSWDGRRIAYVSNRDGQFDVYSSDIENGTVRRLTDHPSVHHSPEFSPDGSLISYCSNRAEHRSNWDTLVAATDGGDERLITDHDGEADEMSYYAGQLPLWSPDGRRVLVASSIRGNYDIMAIDVVSRERTWLLQSPDDEMNARWSPDGERLAFVLNHDGNLVLHVRDLSTGNQWRVSHAEGVSGSLGMRGKGPDYRWTPDGQSIVYGYSGPCEAGSVWIVPSIGGESRLLYSSMPEAVDKDALVAPTVERYESFDGRTISGFLYCPKAGLPAPAIVMPHGGPTGQSTNGWSSLVQHLVRLGYVVFAPNFRGSTGYGREFQWLNKNDWGGADLRDIVEGANWLEAKGIAAGVGIMGGSYGGFMTLAAVTQYPERWKAAVSIYGIANLETMYRTAREDMKQFQLRNIGSPEERPDFYRERSPLHHVDRIMCPLFIFQGERDARVPLEEAEQMKRGLAESGKPFEYVVYEAEGHGFTKFETRLDYTRRIGEFFQRHMPVRGREPISV